MKITTPQKSVLIDDETDRLTRRYGPWLTSDNFTDVVHIGRTTAVSWRRDGIGPKPVKIGRRWLYSARVVAEFLHSR